MTYWSELERIDCGMCGRLAYATNSGIVCECRVADERERERCRQKLTVAALQFAQLRASHAARRSGGSSIWVDRSPSVREAVEEVQHWLRTPDVSGTT